MSHLTYAEAIVVGLFQGVTELFPVSSLGHSILIPALIGGSWARDLSVSAPESPYLAFIVGLHVATAAALLVYFWRDWLRIAGGFLTSVRDRQVKTADQRLAWMLILATIPVGISGLALEHLFRTVLGKPVPAAIFLTFNGLILFGGERLRLRDPDTASARLSAARQPARAGRHAATGAMTAAVPAAPPPAAPASASNGRAASAGPAADPDLASDRRLAGLRFGEATLIGSAQILALLPGISRSGVTMVAGLVRGLSHEDAARFSFLLATPVILAAGVLKIPDLTGPLGAGIGGQVLAGSVCSGLGAYLSVRYLVRYFQTRTLTPFAIYCTVAGLASLAYLMLR
jgi:undecaprenyl-diphosphatase